MSVVNQIRSILKAARKEYEAFGGFEFDWPSVEGEIQTWIFEDQMDVEQIKEAQRRDNVRFDVAVKIRKLLDKTREEYDGDDWDSQEEEINRLVFDETT